MENNSNERTIEESIHTIFEFYRRTRKLSRKIEYYRDKRLSHLPISGAQLYGLWNIYVLKNCTNAELARYSGLAKNSVTTLVKSLQKEGYIITSQDKKDARVTLISLTNKGLTIIDNTINSIDKVNPKLMLLVEIIAQALHDDKTNFQQIKDLLKYD